LPGDKVVFEAFAALSSKAAANCGRSPRVGEMKPIFSGEAPAFVPLVAGRTVILGPEEIRAYQV
jgi:hypothetical protein